MTNPTSPLAAAPPTSMRSHDAAAADAPSNGRDAESLRERLRRIADVYERDSARGTGLMAILSFCSAAGITPTAFAVEAVNNTGLVAQLRRHSTTSPSTRSRISACMRRHVALAWSPSEDVAPGRS